MTDAREKVQLVCLNILNNDTLLIYGKMATGEMDMFVNEFDKWMALLTAQKKGSHFRRTFWRPRNATNKNCNGKNGKEALRTPNWRMRSIWAEKRSFTTSSPTCRIACNYWQMWRRKNDNRHGKCGWDGQYGVCICGGQHRHAEAEGDQRQGWKIPCRP